MTPSERVLSDLMFAHGLELDQGWPLVPLLLQKPDPGRDPTYALDDLNVLVVIARAVTDRLDVNWPMLEEPEKARAARSLSYLMSLLDGFADDAKPRSDNNDNN